jgi:chemotaxis response regulator CheB
VLRCKHRAGYDVVGEAEDGKSSLDGVRKPRPDVVLLVVQLPDLIGFDVARRILEGSDPPAIILVSSRDAEIYGVVAAELRRPAGSPPVAVRPPRSPSATRRTPFARCVFASVTRRGPVIGPCD